jgi:hypothetical protein
VAKYDREYFAKQFEGLPFKALPIIALRAAIRLLPVLARRTSGSEPFYYWKADERARHALTTLRCCQASVFANSLTKTDYAAANAACDAANAAAAIAANVTDAAHAATFAIANAAYDTGVFALYAANAAAKAAAAPSTAAHAAAIAANAAFDASNAAAAIKRDIGMLDVRKPSRIGHGLAEKVNSKTSFPHHSGRTGRVMSLDSFGRNCKAICEASMLGSRFGSIGIKGGLMASPSIGRWNGNGRCFPRSSFHKALPRSMPILRRCAMVR